MKELLNLKEQWQELEQLLTDLSNDNALLMSLLEDSGQIIVNLEQHLASASKGVEDAIENWWHMENLLNEADLVINNWELDYFRLQQKYLRMKRGSVISFSFGTVSFGVGVPLVIEGIRSDNRTMVWSGVGTISIGSVIWAAGHFLFQWW